MTDIPTAIFHRIRFFQRQSPADFLTGYFFQESFPVLLYYISFRVSRQYQIPIRGLIVRAAQFRRNRHKIFALHSIGPHGSRFQIDKINRLKINAQSLNHFGAAHILNSKFMQFRNIAD